MLVTVELSHESTARLKNNLIRQLIMGYFYMLTSWIVFRLQMPDTGLRLRFGIIPHRNAIRWIHNHWHSYAHQRISMIISDGKTARKSNRFSERTALFYKH